MKTHKLLSGETLSVADLNRADVKFLTDLLDESRRDGDYFVLLRKVKGPGAVPLRGCPITPAIALSTLYRVAHDIADRVGIEQGYLLAPEDVPAVDRSSTGEGLLSLTEAALLIGITRPAAHQALNEGRLRGRRVGNAWVVKRADAESFNASRRTSPRRPKPIRPSVGRHAPAALSPQSARGR